MLSSCVDHFCIFFFSYLCMLSCLSHIWLCVILWPVTCQAHLCHGILQARILEGVAMLSSRGFSPFSFYTTFKLKFEQREVEDSKLHFILLLRNDFRFEFLESILCS